MRNLMKKLLITAMPLALAMTLLVSPSAAVSAPVSAAGCAAPIASNVLNHLKNTLGTLASSCAPAQNAAAAKAQPGKALADIVKGICPPATSNAAKDNPACNANGTANGNSCNTVKSTTTTASDIKAATDCAKTNAQSCGTAQKAAKSPSCTTAACNQAASCTPASGAKTGVCGTQDCAKRLDACKKALTGCIGKNAAKCGAAACLPARCKTACGSKCTTTPPVTTTTTAPQTTTTAPQTTTTSKPQTTTTAPQATTTSKPQVTTTAPQATTAPTTTSPKADNLAFERRVVELVNEQRAANGLAPLTLNEKLANVARVKSQDMHDKNYFSHTSPTYGSPFDMMHSFGITYRSAGENIAMGYTSPEAVMEGWMNSPGHRANILNASFTQIGVGYVASGNYWTQEFIG